MCGFSGIVFAAPPDQRPDDAALAAFRAAAGRVAHRGDTEHREWFAPHLWLSHFRLAFQDVASGRQPMLSGDGRHVIVFNGEVYNHLGLREAITRAVGTAFNTRSDTETLIEGWKAFGDAFFEHLEGEYAFLILAVDGSELVAHRDRFGVKPLFLWAQGLDTTPFTLFAPRYGFTSARLDFSSELKGLSAPKAWQREALLRQFVGLYEPIRTPLRETIQIPAGGTLRGRRRDGLMHCELTTFAEPVRRSAHGEIDAHSAEASLVECLRVAVEERLLSDVELGVYLSGGVDSKTVAFELGRLLDRQRRMKSFTVGFTHTGYDETDEALRFAAHLGFDPHVLRVDDTALDYAYPLAVQNSELVQPFTNGAAKWWLSLFTRGYVHGVLTGDGADELLCGYPSYRYSNWWKFAMRGRGEARTVAETLRLLEQRPLGSLRRDRLYSDRFAAHAANPWLAGSSAAGTGRDFVDSLRLLGVPHPLFGQIHAIASALLGDAADDWLAAQAPSLQSWFYAGLESGAAGAGPRDALLLWQNYFAKTHLPVLVLNWVGDRMEMANTLEGRTPFLANGVRRLVATLPDHALVSGLREKVLLRRAYAPLLPAAFVRTPKKQFNAPFLNAAALADRFDAEQVFERCGLADCPPPGRLHAAADAAQARDPYLATHLQSAHQTALALAIVDHSIVGGQALPRDPALEARYLAQAGPVRGQ